jgi:hypothetical protein
MAGLARKKCLEEIWSRWGTSKGSPSHFKAKKSQAGLGPEPGLADISSAKANIL